MACECGRRRELGRRACRVCLELDGETPAEQKVIGILRSLGGRGHIDAIYLETNHTDPRQTFRVLANLEIRGRVGRLDEDGPVSRAHRKGRWRNKVIYYLRSA